jgi:hypothetical protein
VAKRRTGSSDLRAGVDCQMRIAVEPFDRPGRMKRAKRNLGNT